MFADVPYTNDDSFHIKHTLHTLYTKLPCMHVSLSIIMGPHLSKPSVRAGCTLVSYLYKLHVQTTHTLDLHMYHGMGNKTIMYDCVHVQS